jgi:hypothetical protein
LGQGSRVLSQLFEDVLRVEELGVDEFRRQKVLTDDEDFGRDVTARTGLVHVARERPEGNMLTENSGAW